MNKKRSWHKSIPTYAAILLLPLVLILPLYFFVSYTLNSELDKSNNYLLNTLKVGMDAYVQEVESVIEELSTDSTLIKMLDMHEFGADETRAMMQKFNNIKSDSFYIRDAYVLFPNHDCILSGTGVSGIMEYFADIKGLDADSYFAIRKALGKKYKNEFLKSSGASFYNGALTGVYSMPSDDIGILKAQIIIELDISEIIKSMSFKEQYRVFICDKNKLMVYSDESESVEGLIPTVKGNGIYGDNDKYNISSIEAGFNDLTYYIAVKRDEYIKPLIYIRYVIVLLMAVCIVFIVVSVKRIQNVQSNRIVKVLDLFEKDTVSEVSYEELYDKVDKLISEREKLDRELGKHIAQSRKSYIQKLLKNRLTARDKNGKYFAPSKEHMVVVVVTDNYSNIYPGGNYMLTELEKLQESHLIADNILNEYFSENYTVSSAEMDDDLVFIIEGNDISEYAIEQKTGLALEKIKTFFGFSIRCGMARVTDGDYAAAYRMAMERIPKNEEEYFSETMLSKGSEDGFFCFYPQEIEAKIITMLKGKNYEGAKEEIKRIIDINFSKNTPSHSSANLLFMSVIQTMTRTMTELELMHNDSINSHIAGLLTVKEPEEFYGSIEALVDKISCAAVDEHDTDTQFKEKISTYIEKNYTDMNINLYVIADYMDVNPSYLSRKFKKQFQVGILEYIYKMRIEEAKEHLKNDKTVVETATAVGFSTERAFVRAFIKYVGVTPSQYKKQPN